MTLLGHAIIIFFTVAVVFFSLVSQFERPHDCKVAFEKLLFIQKHFWDMKQGSIRLGMGVSFTEGFQHGDATLHCSLWRKISRHAAEPVVGGSQKVLAPKDNGLVQREKRVKQLVPNAEGVHDPVISFH